MLKQDRFIPSLIIFALLSFPVFSQKKTQDPKKKKAEKALVDYVNKLCKDFTDNQLPVDMGTIVTPFAINDGVLSIVRKFRDEEDSTKTYQVRYSVDIDKLNTVFYDYYVGFVSEGDWIKTETAPDSQSGFVPDVNGANMLYIAPLGDGEHGVKITNKLEQLLRKAQSQGSQK